MLRSAEMEALLVRATLTCSVELIRRRCRRDRASDPARTHPYQRGGRLSPVGRRATVADITDIVAGDIDLASMTVQVQSNSPGQHVVNSETQASPQIATHGNQRRPLVTIVTAEAPTIVVDHSPFGRARTGEPSSRHLGIAARRDFQRPHGVLRGRWGRLDDRAGNVLYTAATPAVGCCLGSGSSGAYA